jgi:preprotein translocase subunit SecD
VDEFGVQEPVVQKVGNERIVVELAGIRDPQRAMDIVQKAAFLEFRITDRTSALDKALPAMDRALRGLGVTAGAGQAAPSAVQSLLGGDSAATPSDTTPVEGGAPWSSRAPRREAACRASTSCRKPPTPGWTASSEFRR